MTPREAYRRLGLTPPVTGDDVRAAYIAAARRQHPDLGGDASTMAALNEAYAVAERHTSSRREPCPICDGAGKVYRGRGFARQALECGACAGSGKIIPEAAP